MAGQCLVGYGDIGYAEKFAELIFGVTIVIVPIWSLISAYRKRMQLERTVHGAANPWLAIASATVHFFLSVLILTLIYSLLSISGIKAFDCAKIFWTGGTS